MFGRQANEIGLLKASLQGRTDAFEAIVARYQSLVCAITYSSTGSIDTSEELAQETFLRAWKSLHQLQDLTKFKAWLCSIARSTVQNWFRSRKRDVVGRAASLDGAVDEPSREAGPEEAAIMKEQQALVARALFQIPESLREPLVLFYREQKSTRRVAQQLGLSENAARQRIARGRIALKEKVTAIVETTIASTGPGKAFTVAVAGALAAAGARDASAVAAATGGPSGVGAFASSAVGKAVAVAAGIAVVVGSAVIYRQRTKAVASPNSPSATPAGSAQAAGDNLPIPASGSVGAAGVNAAVAVAIVEDAATGTGTLADSPEGSEGRETPGAFVAEAQARSYEFQAKGALSGLVTDVETGEPVVGIEVRLAGTIHRDMTDEYGFYSIDEIKGAGDYRIRINSKQYLVPVGWNALPVLALSPDRPVVKHFALRLGCAVDVDVRDERGDPVQGAKVAASWLGSRSGDRPDRLDLGEDATDPDGRVIVGAVEPMEIEYRLIARHKEYAAGYADVKLNAPDVVEHVQIVLKDGVEVEGYIEYADGIPVSGARIAAEPDWWHCDHSVSYRTVDDYGIFTFTHIVPGIYSLTASTTPPDREITSWVPVTQVQLPLPDDQTLILRLPMDSPKALVSIRGRILWTSEDRPVLLYIEAVNESTMSRQSMSLRQDAESFEIGRLEPGMYTLRFRGVGLDGEIVRHVPAPSEDLEVALSYRGRPRLRGSVVDARSNEPVDEFRVRVLQFEGLRATTIPQTHWTTCVGGQFDLDIGDPGIFRVQAVAEGYAPTLSAPINTDEGASVTVELTPGGALEGAVIDSTGKPVDGARVIPLSTARGNANKESEMFLTDEGAVRTVQGRFLFEHLPPGRETLKVMHPDYAPMIVGSPLIVEGQTTKNPDVVLTRGGGIEGFVYDAAGEPQANVTLHVQDDRAYLLGDLGTSTRLGVAVTDANGFYRVERLPPDRICYVMRKDWSRAQGLVQRACVPVEGRTERLDLGGPTIVRGTLHKDGAALPLTRLRISNPSRSYSSAFHYYGMTDDHGRFELHGVPPGRYGVYHERPDVRSEWVRVCVVEVADEDIDLDLIDLPTARIEVILHCADGAVDLSSWRVRLQEGTGFLGQPAGMAEQNGSGGSVWTIGDIAPGIYQVIAGRDQVTVRKPVLVEPTDRRLTTEVDIPPATGTVRGVVISDISQSVLMWNSDRTVAAYVPVRQGAFAIEHLPAGHYTVGCFVPGDRAPILEFDLREGEVKTMDIDLTRWSPDLGLLSLFIVGRDGAPLHQAEVWLEGPAGRIDPEPIITEGHRFIAPSGKYTLFIQCPGYEPCIEPVTLPRIHFDRASLQPPRRIIRLRPQ